MTDREVRQILSLSPEHAFEMALRMAESKIPYDDKPAYRDWMDERVREVASVAHRDRQVTR
jgi:hypothetical protein